MAAGLGFKDFTTGEVLTAADVDGYLMQGIWVFATTTARDAAVTAPAEGNFAFTKDTNSLWYYDGAAWVASGATGDIEGVTAGTGISGGGTSGTVTITNSMATAIDAKGDLVAGTGADAFSRLAVGANDTVLTADSTAATGLKWATSSSGGFTSLATGNLSGSSSVSISSIPSGYRQLRLVINSMQSTAGNFSFVFNGDTAANYGFNIIKGAATQYNDQNAITADQSTPTSALNACMIFDIFEYASSVQKNFAFYGGRGDSTNQFSAGFGIWNNTAAMTAIRIDNSNNFTAGSYTLYGVK